MQYLNLWIISLHRKSPLRFLPLTSCYTQVLLPSGAPADRVRLRKALGVKDMGEMGEGRGAGSWKDKESPGADLGNALLGGQW